MGFKLPEPETGARDRSLSPRRSREPAAARRGRGAGAARRSARSSRSSRAAAVGRKRSERWPRMARAAWPPERVDAGTSVRGTRPYRRIRWRAGSPARTDVVVARGAALARPPPLEAPRESAVAGRRRRRRHALGEIFDEQVAQQAEAALGGAAVRISPEPRPVLAEPRS